jgi:pro-apoptotic serine protease NMA111
MRLDFRLKAVTFDCVPWVITMKKNEHYFPTMEWIKDPSEPCGWRRNTYEGGKRIVGEVSEGVVAVVDDLMDAEADVQPLPQEGLAPMAEEA